MEVEEKNSKKINKEEGEEFDFNNNNNKINECNNTCNGKSNNIECCNNNMQNNFNNNNQLCINNFNNFHNMNILENYKSIKQEFRIHQPIGLSNMGATDYMNSSLQCLCNIEKLVNYFKYNKKIEDYIQSKGNSTLTYSFKYLIENLWQSPNNKYILPNYNNKNINNKYFSPYDFKEKISRMDPLFEGVQANDAKYLVNFIIMTLHEELNEIKKNPDLSNNCQIIDQTNHDMVLQYFLQNFDQENKSIISDLFYAISGTSTQCLRCKQIKYNFHNYYFLIFPLEEIRKFKIQKLINSINQNMKDMNPFPFQQNQLNDIQSVNIDDCFQYNEKTDFFTGENAMYCIRCHNQFPVNYAQKLYNGPEILIIILDRGKGKEFNVKLEFTEKINLSQYFKMKNFGNIYNLIGVVTHLGESGSSGHFIAHAKSPIDGIWYTYNDEIVTRVDNFKRQIIDIDSPYILFYQKEK